jgi:hypothetical protein
MILAVPGEMGTIIPAENSITLSPEDMSQLMMAARDRSGMTILDSLLFYNAIMRCRDQQSHRLLSKPTEPIYRIQYTVIVERRRMLAGAVGTLCDG